MLQYSRNLGNVKTCPAPAPPLSAGTDGRGPSPERRSLLWPSALRQHILRLVPACRGRCGAGKARILLTGFLPISETIHTQPNF